MIVAKSTKFWLITNWLIDVISCYRLDFSFQKTSDLSEAVKISDFSDQISLSKSKVADLAIFQSFEFYRLKIDDQSFSSTIAFRKRIRVCNFNFMF